jgi:hypothetical protein
MKPYVQAYWAKTKDFFSRPKVIRRTVIILTSAILLILVLTLVWVIYTKDEPVFVPEEVRGNIQEAIADGGEAIKTLSEPLGSAIVEAGYIHTLESATDSADGDNEATADWPTYTSEELGISFKYPEGWMVEKNTADSLYVFSPSMKDELNSLKEEYSDTDFPYWGGLVLGVNLMQESDIVLGDYAENLYGQDGVKIENVQNGIYVEDAGPDRFGGGTGFYYYKKINNRYFELSLDFFMGQEIDRDLLDKFKDLAESLNE